MATSSFYGDNQFRAYPFKFQPESPLDTRRIVAAKVTCSFGSPFETFPTASLTDWTVKSSEHVLQFSVTDGSITVLLSVTVPKSSAKPFSSFVSNRESETSIRITIGDISQATASVRGVNLPLEPTCTLWLRHRGVQRIQVVNENRQRLDDVVVDNDSIENQLWLIEAYSRPIWVQPTQIRGGGLLLNAGANCLINVSATDNRVTVSPAAGLGSGEVKEFIPLGSTWTTRGLVPEPLPVSENMRPDGLPQHGRMIYSFAGAVGPEVSHGLSSSIVMRNQYGPNTVAVTVASLQGKGC